MRRPLVRTSAPIFNSFKRIVRQVALANWVCCSATAMKRAEQRIGHRGKPQPQLVGAHRGGRGAVERRAAGGHGKAGTRHGQPGDD
jgi:hypothetical protein